MRELKGNWQDMFNGFMLALDLRKMFLGFAGLLLSLGAVGGLLYAFDKADPLILRDPRYLDVDRTIHQPKLMRLLAPRVVELDAQAPVTCARLRASVAATARRVLCQSPGRVRILLPLAIALLLTFIWSYFGGAISRIAAVEVAKDERIETQKALQFAADKFGAFFWAPLICGLGFLFFALWNFLGGFAAGALSHVGHVGEVILAIGLPLAILSGFLMTLIALGTALGSTLFHPAVGAEGTDSFDAISRGFSYVFSRPWHYAWYQIVGTAYGVVCVTFVWWFGGAMLKLGLGAGRLGMAVFGTDAHGRNAFDLLLPDQVTQALFRSDGGYSGGARLFLSGPNLTKAEMVPDAFVTLAPLQMVGAVILGFWLVLFVGMLAGYAVSYFYSSQTLVYFLLRKKVDGIEMNEVFEEKEEDAAGLEPAAAPAPAAGGGVAPAGDAAGTPKSQ